MNHIISHKRLTIDQVKTIIDGGLKLEIGKEAEEAIVKCRRYLDSKMEEIGRPVYGITTGFGSLCNISIPEKELSQLQHNLVMSHACGTGEAIRPEIVKLICYFIENIELEFGSKQELVCNTQFLHVFFCTLTDVSRLLVERNVLILTDDPYVTDHGESLDLTEIVNSGTGEIRNKYHVTLFDGGKTIVAAVESYACCHDRFCESVCRDRQMMPSAVEIYHPEIDHLDVILVDEDPRFLKIT